MEEEPGKIPELGGKAHSELRALFTANHKDVILSVWKDPHKKFVERLYRDYMIHNVVTYYELGEIRVKGEVIAHKSGVSRTLRA